MNDRVAKMTLAGQGPVQWTHVRRAFIDAHVGADTLEMWLAKLATLRLGEGKATTPNELDSQFDKIARHCHPGVPIDSPGIDLMLAEKYSTIIARSNEGMWRRILNSQAPRVTLNDWKRAVAQDFNTQKTLIEWRVAAKAPSSGSQDGGWKGWKSQKGGKKGGYGSERAPPKAAGMSGEDTLEGEDDSPEGRPNTRLSAAGGNQRGGQGGGKRGPAASGGSQQTEEEKAWATEKQRRRVKHLCYNCGLEGHLAGECQNPRSLKATAGQ